MNLTTLQHHAWQMSEDHGFHALPENVSNPGTRLMLVVSEIAEAYEEFRDGRGLNETWYQESGKPEGVPIECADAVIRLADFAECCRFSLDEAVQIKMAYNATRPFLHGGKKA